MPFTNSGSGRIFWRRDGAEDAPTLLLLNDVGTDIGLWERVLSALSQKLCVIRMDLPGQGASDAPDCALSVETLVAHALTVLDAAGRECAFVAGVGIGARIAAALAVAEPDRVAGVVLSGMETEASLPEDPSALLSIAFTPAFAATHPHVLASARASLLDQAPEAYAAIRAALLATPVQAAPKTVPSLVIDTIAAPLACGASSSAYGLRRLTLESGRWVPLEAPTSYAAHVLTFISDVTAGGDVREAQQVIWDAGMKIRRKVLGDAWLDHSMANRNAFNADYQDMVTRCVWHEIWGRPGLDHPTRRLLVLAITASLGRWEEFRLHVKIGLEQGELTSDEIKEVLLQLGAYAGVPVANTGFAEAGELLREQAEHQGG